MKAYKLILFLIIVLSIGFTGCSKNSLKNTLIEARPESSNKQTETIEEKSTYNDDFEAISPYAYNHYIIALLLESETPPDIPAAAEHYKLALQSYPNSYQLRYSLAKTYMAMRLFAETLELLSIIQPVDKKVLQLQGMSYLRVGIQDSAKYVYERLARIAPNEPTSYHYLSGFYSHAKNTDSLIWVYENLSRLLPFNEKYWQELGKLKAQKGEFQSAKNAFITSLEKNNSATNIISFVGLAEMYKIEQKYDSVLITYKKALAVDSTNPALYEDISMLYARLDSLEQAIPYAKKVIELNPQDLMALRRLGVIYFGSLKFDLAETVFTDIVNRGERHFLNHFYLGRIAAQRKDYKIAVDEFKIMVQLNDTIPEHWMDLGYAYRKLDDLPHELLAYRTGITKSKDDNVRIKLLFSLGAAYEQGKMIDSAIVTFEKILSIAPEHHQAMNYLGYMLVDKGEQLSYAKQLIEKALKIEPNNAAYLDSYGWLFYQLKKYKQAVKHLKIAAELQEDSVIYEHLGDAYNAKGDLTQAMNWWEKALKLNPDNEAIINKMK